MSDDVIGGRYRIESLVAEGGMAKVYRATDQRLGRTVAIKVLSAHLATDTQFVARFEAEAKAAASLDHPNLVRVFDTGVDGGRHYIAMEYVQGPTLAELMARDGALEPSIAVNVAARVCDALAAAHRLGLVHRDVKPANIMLEDVRTVKVMDFGIAKTATGGLTQAGDVLGTAAYLSPEQARGGAVDLRSDIYSLGCVLYEMLTGRTPLSGETLLEVANRLATERPAPPSELNAAVGVELDQVVMRALEKDPDRRFDSASQMREALQAIGGAPGSSANPKTLIAPAPVGRRPKRRSWPPVAALGLLALVALIVVGRMLVPAVTDSAAEPSVSPAEPSPSARLPEVAVEAPSPERRALPEVAGPSGAEAVADAVDALRSLVESAITSGDMSADAGEDVLSEVFEARSEYDDEEFGDAVEHIGKAREELEDYREDDEVAPGAVSSISGHLDNLQRLVSL